MFDPAFSFRKIVLMLAILALLLTALPAALPQVRAEADEPEILLAQEAAYWVDSVYYQYAYESLNVEKGTRYPVYAAPYENAWRGAGGKAAVSVSEPFILLGTADHGNWLWVYYQIDPKSGRVGWVYAPEADSAVCDAFPNDNKPLVIQDDAVAVTDDPFGSRRTIATLRKGDRVIALGSVENPNYIGDYWLYIEIEIDGQPAWGFIRDALVQEVPLYHVEGNTLVIHEGVTRIGMPDYYYDYDDEYGEYGTIEMDFDQRPGDLSVYSQLELWDLCAGSLDSISLPSTLRTLGRGAFCSGNIKEFRVPDNVEKISSWPFYGVSIDRFILSGGFTGDIDPWMLSDHTNVKEFVVEEGNPKYAARDGVLFSADGKTLYYYPAGKTETHYDVPRGVEIIGDCAFYDDEMGNPLQSVSLPIGLKKIGKYAFGGCGRLISISIPLTVESVDETAFQYCVSLERVSAPPGIDIVLPSEDNWAEPVNNTYYMGDNGFTGWAPEEAEWNRVYMQGWVVADAGEEAALAYSSQDGQDVVRLIPSGTYTYGDYYGEEKSRRIDVGSYDNPAWISLDNFLPDPGAVFFAVSDADFAPGVYVSDQGSLADPADYQFSTLGHADLTAIFYRAYVTQGYYIYDEVHVPIRDCTLYRRSGDADSVYGLLIADDPMEEIWLRDEPAGNETIRLFSLFQGKVLEERGDWLLVRTALGDGWAPREHFIPVYLKEE